MGASSITGSLTIKPQSLPLVRHSGAQGLNLYPHQAVMLESDAALSVLAAGTGTGKTQAALLPIILARQRAVLVYPTNALLEDQRRSVLALLQRLSVPVQELGEAEPEGAPGGYTVVWLDADTLERRRRARRRRTKGAVLGELLDPSGPRLVLTNPDVLYQIFAWRYHEPVRHVAALQAYPNLVLDEFHLYAGVELTNLLGVVSIGRTMGAFERIIVLSATPQPEVVRLLERTIGTQGERVDAAGPFAGVDTGRQRVIAHPVTLSGRRVATPDDLVEVLADILDERRRQLLAARESRAHEPEFVPAVAIVNSVVDARLVEEALISRRWQPEEIAPIRGLVGRPARDPRGRLLVLGTSAIEVGVDFSTDLLCFQAGDAASFIQRFGRVGRHQPGEAILLGDSREMDALEALARECGGAVERQELAGFARQIYRERDAMAWFATTEGGATVLLCLEESLIKAIREDPGEMSEANVEALCERVRSLVEEHASRLDLEAARQLSRLRICLHAARQSSRHRFSYLVPLVEAHPTLRSSVPTVRVWDHGEAERRGKAGAQYDVEVTRLARQGRGVRVECRPDGSLAVFVARYERGGRAYLNEHLAPGWHCASTIPGLRLCNPGGPLPTEIFDAEKQVLFVTTSDVRRNLDWRVSVVRCGECGESWAAMGWGALVLHEITRRSAPA